MSVISFSGFLAIMPSTKQLSKTSLYNDESKICVSYFTISSLHESKCFAELRFGIFRYQARLKWKRHRRSSVFGKPNSITQCIDVLKSNTNLFGFVFAVPDFFLIIRHVFLTFYLLKSTILMMRIVILFWKPRIAKAVCTFFGCCATWRNSRRIRVTHNVMTTCVRRAKEILICRTAIGGGRRKTRN